MLSASKPGSELPSVAKPVIFTSGNPEAAGTAPAIAFGLMPSSVEVVVASREVSVQNRVNEYRTSNTEVGLNVFT